MKSITICHLPRATCRRGQGLLETVVAMSVLLTGIVTLMTLVIVSSIGRRSSEFQTVAANLAREGIEVAVMKRNDNWIKNNPFDAGLSSGTDYTFVEFFDPIANSWAFNFTPNDFTSNVTKIYKYTSVSNKGLMVQAASQPVNTVYSGYDRIIAADLICYDGASETYAASGATCSGSPGKIGLRITSLVQWQEHNGMHSISEVETIYDWR